MAQSYPGTTSSTAEIPPIMVSSGQENAVTSTTTPVATSRVLPGDDLPTTGSDVFPIVGLGLGLVLFGGAVVAAVRSRKTEDR